MLRTHENYHNILFVNALPHTRLANCEPHASSGEFCRRSRSELWRDEAADDGGWLYEVRALGVADVVAIMKWKDLLTFARKEVLVSRAGGDRTHDQGIMSPLL